MKNIAKKMLTQISREYWEHKIIMLWLPVGITLITLLLQGYATLNSLTYDKSAADGTPSGISYSYTESSVENISADGTRAQKSAGEVDATFNTKNLTAPELLLTILGRNTAVNSKSPFESTLTGFAFLMFVLLFFSLLTYAHSCLYDDRARKEILFWRSMPVSEAQNLLCKLLVILIVIPAIYSLMILVYGAGALLLQNAGGENWLVLFLKVSQITITVILFTLVFIPLISWILFCSAAAKKSPIYLSLLLPLALGMIFKFVFGKNYITAAIANYVKAFGSQVKFGPELLQQMVGFLPTAEFFIALTIATGLLVATVWLRNYRYEL